MRTTTTLLALGLASISGVLSLALALSIVAAGFAGSTAWPEVSLQAPLALALGMVTLGLIASHTLEIRRRGAWPPTSTRRLVVAALAAALGFVLFNDAGFYACSPSGCFNLLTMAFPFLHRAPYLRGAEQAVGIVLLAMPGVALGRPRPPRTTTTAAA